MSAYEFNPVCGCDWCRNAGKPPQGYWVDGQYGRVFYVTDSYGNEHVPPRSLRFQALGATTLEVNS